jgi:hypothetical protein
MASACYRRRASKEVNLFRRYESSQTILLTVEPIARHKVGVTKRLDQLASATTSALARGCAKGSFFQNKEPSSTAAIFSGVGPASESSMLRNSA